MNQQRNKAAALLISLFALASSPAWAADIAKGRATYTSYCASCHGATGVSVMPGAPNFSRSEGLLQSDMVLLNSIKSGKNAMPGFQGMLTDQDILNVIAYMRTLN